MLRQRSDQALLLTLGAVDLVGVSVMWLVAYALRWSAGIIAPVEEVPPLWWCVRTLPIVWIAALFSFRVSGLYQVGRRWSLGQEFAVCLKASTLMVLVLLAATFYIQNPYESRLVHLFFWGGSVLVLMASRRTCGGYFRWRRKLGARSSALIVGTGRAARRLENVLRRNNWLAVTPVGFVDDLGGSQRGAACPTVGTVEELPELIERHRVEYLFVALPLERFAEIKRILRRVANTLVEVRLVPDVAGITAMQAQPGEIEGLTVLNLRGTRHGLADAVAKRAMDIAFSALGLVFLSPVMALIALVIKLSDGGPIFYRQERMGLNGRRFHMFKFRSMRVGAEDATGPVWARQGDERRTWFGTMLRETSLDELPQLFNVLVGDMSLVGPRPERPFFIEKFRASIPRYMLRHAVKAGMTGWAQVNGWRGNTSLRKRVQYDLYYVTHWSVWLDLRIIFTTVFRTMWDRNAY